MIRKELSVVIPLPWVWLGEGDVILKDEKRGRMGGGFARDLKRPISPVKGQKGQAQDRAGQDRTGKE